MSTVLLNQSDIKSLMDIKEVVDIVEKTFRGFGASHRCQTYTFDKTVFSVKNES